MVRSVTNNGDTGEEQKQNGQKYFITYIILCT